MSTLYILAVAGKCLSINWKEFLYSKTRKMFAESVFISETTIGMIAWKRQGRR